MPDRVGLDRQAVGEAFGEFIGDGTASAEQIDFITMVIEHLTDRGIIDPALLYESPFTTVAPAGSVNVFGMKRTDRLFAVIKAVNDSAVA